MKTFTMAWRNIWRNKRRTLVTIGAMSLALLVMILYASLIDGYIKGLEKNILDYEIGDVQIFAAGYQDDPSLYKTIEQPRELTKKIEDKGYLASARLKAMGLAAAGDTSAGVIFTGLDVKEDARVSLVHKRIKKGVWLDPADPSGVVLGGRLARNLGLGVGGELVVLSQAADGSMANDLYTVRGLLADISDAVDRSGVFMNEGTFRELFSLPEGAHQVIARRADGVPLSVIAADVKAIAKNLDAQTWRELLPTLASMLDSTSSMMFVMFLIVYFAIGIVMLNAMLMAVFERIREFGVLKAIGVGPFRVLLLIFFESSIQTTLAVLAGLLLSVPGMWYLISVGIDFTWIGGVSVAGIAWDPIWRAALSSSSYVQPVVTLVAIVSVAILYPAFKAALIRPVRAMQQQ